MLGIGKSGSSFLSTPETDGNIHCAITLCASASEENEITFLYTQGTKRRLPRRPGTSTWPWSYKDGRQPGSNLKPQRTRNLKPLLRYPISLAGFERRTRVGRHFGGVLQRFSANRCRIIRHRRNEAKVRLPHWGTQQVVGAGRAGQAGRSDAGPGSAMEGRVF